MTKRLYCSVCDKFFDALLSTPDVVALRQHANASKSEAHKLLRKERSPISSSMLSVQSENGDTDSHCSLDGIEDRRLNLVACCL